ncbi:MAG: type I methionyl aminopeptidase [Candidatus Pacebacteria bacterium]|nr:type I methionyl aminopeptidase [Candidatus Paceibacterota bacterium]
MIFLKNSEEIKVMAQGGQILSQILGEVRKEVRDGVATKYLNEVAENLILKYGGEPSFKGYGGYPAALCVSINEEIVHGVPSERKLKEGDIVSLDIGIKHKGYHTDMAITVPVGKIPPEVEMLLRVTRETLRVELSEVKIGNTLGDVGNIAQKYVEKQGFSVIRDLCGHGIGKELHEDPQILNYGDRHTGPKFREGMVFCLEPMVSMGDYRIKKMRDGFGYATKDDSLSAHFEQTIALTHQGWLILTPFDACDKII